MIERQTRITVYVPKDQYTKLRIKLLTLGISVSEWFRRKIKEELKSN